MPALCCGHILVCSLQCVTGYTPDVNCTHCYLTDICEANEPCQNGGNCTLTAGLPDQYQCDCHENITGYTGINCTGAETIASLIWLHVHACICLIL